MPQLEEHTSLAELRALRDEWRALWERCESATPFQHPDWLCAWVEHFQPEAPRVLALRRSGRLVGLVPMLIYREGARRVLGLLGGGVSDYLDGLFEGGLEDGIAALLTYLQAQRAHWDECRFEQLRPDSPLLAARAPAGYRVAREQQTVCPQLRLPASVGELDRVVGRSVLHDARYNSRRCQRQGKLRFELVHGHQLERGWGELMRMHGARWAARDQSGLRDEPVLQRFQRQVAPAMQAAGLLHLYLLRLDGRAIAASYVLELRRCAYYYLCAFDPEFERVSPASSRSCTRSRPRSATAATHSTCCAVTSHTSTLGARAIVRCCAGNWFRSRQRQCSANARSSGPERGAARRVLRI
jgi:CelD/BcsL family acetyltransferase involved in cellulose biosynthesis